MGQIPAAGGLGRLFSVRWPNWIEHYAVNGFVHEDIVIQETIRSLEPFTWTELKTRRPGAGTRIFEACDSFGWPDGLTVPVDGPDLRRGFVSLAAPSSLKFLRNAERAELIELSLSAYVKSWTLASVRNEASPSLSVREQEALSHVAKGRDDAEIASIMSISKATAHAHVERAKRRLGATTRAQAVAVAIRAKLI